MDTLRRSLDTFIESRMRQVDFLASTSEDYRRTDDAITEHLAALSKVLAPEQIMMIEECNERLRDLSTQYAMIAYLQGYRDALRVLSM